MNIAIRSIVAGAGLATLAFQTNAQEGTSSMENKIVINQSVELSVYHTGPKGSWFVIACA